MLKYLQGETLAERLQKGPLPPAEVLKIGIEICEGLEKAHRCGIIHLHGKFMVYGKSQPGGAELWMLPLGGAPVNFFAATSSSLGGIGGR